MELHVNLWIFCLVEVRIICLIEKIAPKDYSFVALLNFNQFYILLFLSWQKE